MDLGNVGPTIMMDANNAMYTHYYLAGAALTPGYGTGQGNIVYQWDNMAVPASSDIKVVIWDGGGNDILINNSQCLTTPLQGDTMCHMVVDKSVATAQMLDQDMVSHGVQAIVYFFYPHIDPTSRPNAGDWNDYAIPQDAANCCGAANVPTGPDATCEGTGPGVKCVFVDTRPEFEGHNLPSSTDYWFQADGIHPNQPGANAIAGKVWAQMQKYCIAQ
jgi:lysophospholipase L1-like esterase